MTPRLAPEFLKAPLAHRALHDVKAGRPENSRAAIAAAIDVGYGIEIDLQLSRDEQAMVFHDYSLQRLAGIKGAVRQNTAEDLSQVVLIGGDETIPSLSEVLELVAGQVPLLIELKDQDGAMGPNVGPLETATAKALDGYGGPVAVMSFNPHSSAKMAKLCPQIPRGITTSSYEYDSWPTLPRHICDHLRDIPDFDDVKASFISHEVTDLDNKRVIELKAQGADILCWTVTSPQIEAEARKVVRNVTFEQYLAKIPA